jgi:hypothetical protein
LSGNAMPTRAHSVGTFRAGHGKLHTRGLIAVKCRSCESSEDVSIEIAI